MSVTPNYNLFVTDDANTNFIDWRQALTGVSDSNMTKIDAALFKKAEKSSILSGTLFANKWDGESTPFRQSISFPELTESQNGVIFIPNDATSEQRQAAMDASFFIVGQQDGTLTIGASYAKPKIDIPVSVILIN